MSKLVSINGTTYTLPEQGDNPPYGETLSDLLQALVDVAGSISGPGDILSTNFSILNNVSSAANITGLSFDTSIVRSATVSYSISLSTSTSELTESGILLLSYTSSAPSGWSLSRYSNIKTNPVDSDDDFGVTFTITSAGQIQYTSHNIGGTGYTGKLKFSAKVFTQT